MKSDEWGTMLVMWLYLYLGSKDVKDIVKYGYNENKDRRFLNVLYMKEKEKI